MSNLTILILVAVGMACILGGITLVTHLYNLNGIKAKTVGNGQHGMARWATKREIRKTYCFVSFTPKKWRAQAAQGNQPTGTDNKPLAQGIVVGCTGNTTGVAALAKGMTLDEAISRLKGIQCRNGTSCPDQLARALEAYKAEEAK